MNAPLPESIRKALETVTLDDKYRLERGRAFMSGVQALVRLPMLQRTRDAAAGSCEGSDECRTRVRAGAFLLCGLAWGSGNNVAESADKSEE